MNDELYEKVNSFKNGNEYAFTYIYMHTYNMVYKCIFKVTKNESDTNDIVQIVYLKIYKKIDTLDSVEKFKPWLLSIVYNESKNFVTSRQRSHKYIDSSFDISERADSIDVCDDDCNIEGHYEEYETNEILKTLIKELPPEQSQVLMLYYFQEKEVTEISEILGIPTGTVKSRLNYARKKLKKSISEYESRNQVRLHSSVLGFITVQSLASSASKFTGLIPLLKIATPFVAASLTLVSVGAVTFPEDTRPEKVNEIVMTRSAIVQTAEEKTPNQEIKNADNMTFTDNQSVSYPETIREEIYSENTEEYVTTTLTTHTEVSRETTVHTTVTTVTTDTKEVDNYKHTKPFSDENKYTDRETEHHEEREELRDSYEHSDYIDNEEKEYKNNYRHDNLPEYDYEYDFGHDVDYEYKCGQWQYLTESDGNDCDYVREIPEKSEKTEKAERENFYSEEQERENHHVDYSLDIMTE